MTITSTPPASGIGTARVEGIVQIVIMLAIGGAAGAASFTHVHNVAAAHGQGGWLAWADAVVLELMSVASGLEMRRRKRQDKRVLFPATVLVCAVALSISAQVVEAERSVIGWTAAALPALGFLVMVKIALGRSTPSQSVLAAANSTEASLVLEPDTSTTVPAAHDRPHRELTGGDDHEPEPGRGLGGEDGRTEPSHVAGTVPVPDAVDGDATVANVAALLPMARIARDALAGRGRSLTRDTLAEQLRKDGHPMRNARVSLLLAMLRAETDAEAAGQGEGDAVAG